MIGMDLCLHSYKEDDMQGRQRQLQHGIQLCFQVNVAKLYAMLQGGGTYIAEQKLLSIV